MVADYPAFVFYICPLTNKYQKYKSVELGDQVGNRISHGVSHGIYHGVNLTVSHGVHHQVGHGVMGRS